MSADLSSDREASPIINLAGERVALGPLRRDLIPFYQKWANDFEVMRTWAPGFPTVTYETQEARYGDSGKNHDWVNFTIYERADLRPIGRTFLYQINHFHRSAEFGILIGEKDCWNKGYGTETAILMLDYGFTGLGLHNIMLWAVSYNERGLSAYRRAGFKEIGRRRQAWRIGGEGYDLVYMDCLATEFESRAMRQYLP